MHGSSKQFLNSAMVATPLNQIGEDAPSTQEPLSEHPDRKLIAPFQPGEPNQQQPLTLPTGVSPKQPAASPANPNSVSNNSSLTPQKRSAQLTSEQQQSTPAKKRNSEPKRLGETNALFPPLEAFDIIERKREEYVGPTTESNWVLPGKLLCGAYPGVEDDDENMTLLWSILNCGITTFCCLQVEYPGPEVTESMWRSGQAIRPYYNDVVQIIDHVDNMRKINPQAQHEKVTNSNNLDFVHIPIVDCSVTDDTSILNLCKDLVDRIAKGETIYLHCWGGHGRTGTAICIMLHMMYGMKSSECLKYCQFVHDLRKIPIAVGSPQTQMQRDQVIRVIANLEKKKKEEEENQRRERANSLKRDSGISPSHKRSNNSSPSKKNGSPANGSGGFDGFEIHNGSNGQAAVSGNTPSALSVEAAEVGGRKSRVSNVGNSSGKKSLRQMREQSRDKRRESDKQTPTKVEKEKNFEQSDNDMLISGLQLVKVKETTVGNGGAVGSKESPSKEKTAESTPDNSPPGGGGGGGEKNSSGNSNSNGGGSSSLPLMESSKLTPNSKNKDNGKVDEILKASPVVKVIKPVPPSGGKNRGTFGKRNVK